MSAGLLFRGFFVVSGLVVGAVWAKPALAAKGSAKASAFKTVKANSAQIAAANAALKSSAKCPEAAVAADHAFIVKQGTQGEQAFFPASSMNRVCLVYQMGAGPLGVYVSDSEPPGCMNCGLEALVAIAFPDLNGDGRRDVSVAGAGIVGWDPQGVGAIGGHVFFAWTMTPAGPVSIDADRIDQVTYSGNGSSSKSMSLRAFNKKLMTLMPSPSPVRSTPVKAIDRSTASPTMDVLHFLKGKVLITELQSQTTRVSPLSKVLAMAADPWGGWWVLRETSAGGELLWLPANLDLKRQQVVKSRLELMTPSNKSIGRVQIKGTDWSFKLTTFGAYERAERQCGTVDGSDALCTEAAGWGSPATLEVKLSPQQARSVGWERDAQTNKGAGEPLTVKLPEIMSSSPCECWGEDAECGSGTMLGSSGVGVVLTDIECGDLAHMTCALTTKNGDRFGSLGSAWTKRAHMKKDHLPGASCGPYWVSSDGGWLSVGRGVFCSAADPSNCTAAVPGRFIGVGGKSLSKFSR